MNDRSSHRLRRDKRALRRDVLARRDALPESERARRSAEIVERLLALDETARARTVLAFWSFGSEVATLPLLERLAARGTMVALPRIQAGEVHPVVYAPGSEMTATAFGSMEPAEGEVLDVRELDLVVVPGVAFDRACRRVGYGGGFYDRLLRTHRGDAAAVAIAFELQVVPRVPSGAVDHPVDAIVTEREVIRCP